jgi:glucose-1-phosphate thymidylyltransferase
MEDFMKGIVLAGGLGTRMHPLTKVTNKHLLPLYREPMIYYPIRTLVNAGIDEILIVTGLKHLNYTYQEGEGGIAAALDLAAHFADGDKIAVVLGDNIIEKNIRMAVDAFKKQERGAKILLKEVTDPQRFGVPAFEGERIVRIDEKPKQPASNYAVIGIYMYDATVFEVIKTLKPSNRGELEITDVNNHYIREGTITWDVLDGWWSDAGTFDSLIYAGNMVAKTGANKRD